MVPQTIGTTAVATMTTETTALDHNRREFFIDDPSLRDTLTNTISTEIETGGDSQGSIVNPFFAEIYGRRPCLAISTIVYTLGASLQTYAPFMWVMSLGWLGTGGGIGMLSICATVFEEV